jgi:hypothetical protein
MVRGFNMDKERVRLLEEIKDAVVKLPFGEHVALPWCRESFPALDKALHEFAAYEVAPNIHKPAVHVYHKNLKRENDESHFKSKCPCCSNGVLLVFRDQTPPYTLKDVDACIVCGQEFYYLDIDDLRKLECI